MHFLENFVDDVIVWLGGNVWLGLVFAPILGLIMSFMPCCLANVALVVRSVDNYTKDNKNKDSAENKDSTQNNKDKLTKKQKNQVLKYVFLFALGSLIVFFVIGLSVGLIGNALSSVEWLFHVIVGAALIATSVWYIIKNLRQKHACCGHEYNTIGHEHNKELEVGQFDDKVNTDNNIDKNQVNNQTKDQTNSSPTNDNQTNDNHINDNHTNNDTLIDDSSDTLKKAKQDCDNDCHSCDCVCDCHYHTHHHHKHNKNRVTSKWQAFLYGVVGAVFNTPCSIPAIVAILAYSVAVESVVLGIAMIFLYAVGHSILIVVAGLSVGFVKKMQKIDKVTNHTMVRIVKIVLLVLVIALAVYIIYTGFEELLDK